MKKFIIHAGDPMMTINAGDFHMTVNQRYMEQLPATTRKHFYSLVAKKQIKEDTNNVKHKKKRGTSRNCR